MLNVKVKEMRRGLFHVSCDICRFDTKVFELVGSQKNACYILESEWSLVPSNIHTNHVVCTLSLKRFELDERHTSSRGRVNSIGRQENNQQLPLHVWVSLDHAMPINMKLKAGEWRLTYNRKIKPIPTVLVLDFGTETAGRNRIMDGLSNLFSDQINCDVHFHLKDHQYVGAHVAILSVGSPVFTAMFQPGSFREADTKEVAIEDIEPDVFKQLLAYMYTGNAPALDINKTMAQPLFEAADKYGVELLKSDCAQVLLTGLTIDNVIQMLVWSHVHGVSQLQEAAVQFVAVNEDICFQPEWEHLAKDYPDLCVAATRRIAGRLSSTVKELERKSKMST